MQDPIRIDAAILETITHFQHRVIQDALTECTSAYWAKRAAQFAAVGTPTCDELATSCTNAARFWAYVAGGDL